MSSAGSAIYVESREIAENFFACARPPKRRPGNILQSHCMELIWYWEHLHGDVVFDAVGGIDPVGRSGLEAGTQREQKALRDVVLI